MSHFDTLDELGVPAEVAGRVMEVAYGAREEVLGEDSSVPTVPAADAPGDEAGPAVG